MVTKGVSFDSISIIDPQICSKNYGNTSSIEFFFRCLRGTLNFKELKYIVCPSKEVEEHKSVNATIVKQLKKTQF